MGKLNLTEALKQLEEINTWFESQKEIDVEKGLEKVREGAKLVKASRERLQEIENEFEEVKKEISDERTKENIVDISNDKTKGQAKVENDIPF